MPSAHVCFSKGFRVRSFVYFIFDQIFYRIARALCAVSDSTILPLRQLGFKSNRTKSSRAFSPRVRPVWSRRFFGDAIRSHQRVVGLVVRKRHNQMRNSGAENLRGRADAALMYDASRLRKNARIRRVIKTCDIFVQDFRRLVENSVKQNGAFL